MDCEIITSSQSSQTRPSVEKINILVVDDDTTCLSIIAAILKTWKYEVVTVKHAIDALCTLRIMGGSFDLVVSDVHMPDMNGFELQKQIDREFNLPVVLMSADNEECVIMKGLENGAALFLVKPIAPDDLKNLWQYAFVKKKKKGKAIVDEIGPQPNIAFSNEDIDSESPVYENKKDSKRKVTANDHKSDEKEEDEEEDEEENNDSASMKKTKVVWTNTLHNKFLEAIKILGLDRAVPKKILEFMNVPGLTRENVASHLQKYRIFLRRVSDASYKIQSAAENSLLDMAFRSNFVPGQPSLTHQNQTRTSFQPMFGKHVPIAKTSKHDHLICTGGSISRPLYGQSLLICNRGTMKQPMIGNSNSIYHNQTNRLGLNGGISSGLMTGTNLTQMYPTNTPLGSLSNCLSMYNSSKFGHGGANYNNIGYAKNFKNSNMKSNLDSSNNSYVGYRIASGNGGEELNGVKGGYGLINGIQPSNMVSGPILSGNGKACLAKELSSASGFVGSNPMFTNAIQQENGSVPQKKDNPVQEVESIDDLFDLITNSSTLDNNSHQHGRGDLTSGFLNTQQGGGEDPHFSYSLGSNINVEDYHPIGNKQSLEKQHGEEDMDSNFSIGGSQLDEYFPWFDESTNQFDDQEFLEPVFSDGAFGGSDGLGGL